MANMKELFDEILKIRFEYPNATIQILTKKLNENFIFKTFNYYLTGDNYIIDNNWLLGVTVNKNKAMSVTDFINMIEKEATDNCWDCDIYTSRIDSCLEGKFFLIDMDKYNNINDENNKEIALKENIILYAQDRNEVALIDF